MVHDGSLEKANSPQPGRPGVAVCAATYRRLDGLGRLLDGLAGLEFAEHTPAITVIIVDNDPNGSARETVDQRQSTFPWSLVYVNETQPGTPFARNAALEVVPDEADFVCFIDDDESPQPQWLDTLLAVQQQQRADVVTGPVIAVYEPGVPDWVKRGGFFQRPRYATGSVRHAAFTNNVMLRADLIRNPPRRFDTQFLSGVGEDQEFFHRIAWEGHRIVWADDAEVREWIPAARAQAGWLIRRMYTIGRAMSCIAIRYGHPLGSRVVQCAKGIVWLTIALCTLPCGLLARRWAVRSLRWLAYGAGLLRGLF